MMIDAMKSRVLEAIEKHTKWKVPISKLYVMGDEDVIKIGIDECITDEATLGEFVKVGMELKARIEIDPIEDDRPILISFVVPMRANIEKRTIIVKKWSPDSEEEEEKEKP